MKIYTGIGSRETPEDVLGMMTLIAALLQRDGWTLRSGCAPGADSAFELGAGSDHELYLPWAGFEGRTDVRLTEPAPEAYPIAARFHPAWDRLSSGVRALHARNVHQVLGADVTKPIFSSYVMCWTRNGAGGGGTGQALRIAQHYGVRILDLGCAEHRARLMAWISTRADAGLL